MNSKAKVINLPALGVSQNSTRALESVYGHSCIKQSMFRTQAGTGCAEHTGVMTVAVGIADQQEIARRNIRI